MIAPPPMPKRPASTPLTMPPAMTASASHASSLSGTPSIPWRYERACGASRENEGAAAHVQSLAGDEAAAGSAQKAHSGGDLFGLAGAAERDRRFGICARAAVRGTLRIDAAGRHAIH